MDEIKTQQQQQSKFYCNRCFQLNVLKDHAEVKERRLNETANLFDTIVLEKLQEYSKDIEVRWA